jgi:hypothetical protein
MSRRVLFAVTDDGGYTYIKSFREFHLNVCNVCMLLH